MPTKPLPIWDARCTQRGFAPREKFLIQVARRLAKFDEHDTRTNCDDLRSVSVITRPRLPSCARWPLVVGRSTDASKLSPDPRLRPISRSRSPLRLTGRG